MYLFIFTVFHLFIYLIIYLFVYLFIFYFSVIHLLVHPFIYLFILLVLAFYISLDCTGEIGGLVDVSLQLNYTQIAGTSINTSSQKTLFLQVKKQCEKTGKLHIILQKKKQMLVLRLVFKHRKPFEGMKLPDQFRLFECLNTQRNTSSF